MTKKELNCKSASAMRIWLLLTVVGILTLGAGGYFLLEGHHTLGLAGSALGLALVAGGAVLGYRQGRVAANLRSPSGVPRGPSPRGPSGRGTRNSIIAIFVVVAVGAGTFYATTYLATGPQGGGTTSTSQSSLTPSSRTFGTSITSSTGPVSSTGSSAASSSSSTKIETSSTSAFSSSSSSMSVTSTESTQEWPFNFSFSPIVTIVHDEAYLNVSYTSSLNYSVRVYEKITLYQGSSGSPIGSVLLIVAAKEGMNLYLDMGNLSPGSYSVVFFVVNYDTNDQLSQPTTISFSV